MSLILLGFGESLATPEVFWSLRSGGYEVAAFFRRGSRSAARRLRGMRVIDVVAPETSVDGFRAELRNACTDLAAQGCRSVLPMDDASLLVLHDQELGLPFLGPQGEQASLAIDKSLQLSLAEAAGFSVPTYIVVDGTRASDVSVESLRGEAVIAKPARIGRVQSDRLSRPSARYFEEPHSALDWIREGTDHGTTWIIQRVLRGTGEGVFGVSTGSGLRSVSGHRRVRMMNPAGSGSSACRSIPVDDDLRTAAGDFCSSAGWRGLYMIELLRDRQGKAWFMELNGRPWGSMALARRRHLEYPLWHVEQQLGGRECPEVVPQGEITCRHLGRELVHLLFVLRGNKGGAPMWPSRLSTLRDMARFGQHTCWYNSDPSQRLFTVRDAIETLRKQVR